MPAGTPVVTGTGDAPSGLLGAGIVDAATMLLSLSTGAQVMVPDDAFHPDLAGRTHAFCSALEPGAGRPGWYQMGATLVAGMALRWLRDEMLQLPAAGAYEQMMSGLEGALGRSRSLVSAVSGRRAVAPHGPGARGAFLGLAAHHDHGDVVRAVMEGVTFACRDAFAALQEAGANPERIVMAGGGSRSPFWRQMVADLFGFRSTRWRPPIKPPWAPRCWRPAVSVSSIRSRPRSAGSATGGIDAERGSARPIQRTLRALPGGVRSGHWR